MELRSRRISEGSYKPDQEMVAEKLPFRSKKKLSYPETGISPSREKSQVSDPSFSLQTPQKPVGSRANRRYVRSVDEVRRVAKDICVEKKDSEHKSKSPMKVAKNKLTPKLPPKYEGLCDQFDSMVSSIRLLRLRGYASTFVNICSSVQALTNRGFSHTHLAQLKYLMPEVIDIGTTLVQDEKTSCVKPEILVTLRPEALKDNMLKANGGSYLVLSRVVRSRLSAFIESRPEDEVPEQTLPEPFNQRIQSMQGETKLNSHCDAEKNLDTSRDKSSTETVAQPPLACFTSRFQKRFSQKTPILESQKTQLLSLPTPYTSNVDDVLNPITSSSSSGSSPTKHIAVSNLRPFGIKRLSRFATSMDSTPKKDSMFCQDLDSTPLAPSKIHCNLGCHANDLNGPEIVSSETNCTPAGLMSNTPDLFTPKRARITPESNSTPYIKTPRRMIKRTLNFPSPVNSMEKESKRAMFSVDEEIVKSLPSTLLQSLEAKEKKLIEEKEAGIPEAKWRQKMTSYLPKLFDMVYLIFQSAKCSVITKRELLYKITTQNLDIVDQRETEEQLKLLQELVPDWICGKKASSGDFIFCISKVADPESLRARLVEAGRMGS